MIALAAEAAVPVRGLFGAWDQQTLSLFGASALFLISCAAVRSLLMPLTVDKKRETHKVNNHGGRKVVQTFA